MLILGLESSCDETAAAVLSKDENGRFQILSNEIASQIETHRLYGGVVPEIASRAHIEAISGLTYTALEHAGVSLSEIQAVCVTDHPGLIGALLVGVNFGKALAARNGIPLVPVDHLKGHVAAAYLAEGDIPKPPFLSILTSGGHTGIYLVESYTDYRLIGSTRDDAIGEAFDKIGRLVGLPYPAGREFDALAREGFRLALGSDDGDLVARYRSHAVKSHPLLLPSPAIQGDSLDFSFSGLKTAAMNLIHRYEMKGEPLPRAAFAAMYTYTAVSAVVEKAGLALRRFGALPLVLAGGVAANSHLRTALSSLAEKEGRRLYLPPLSLCGDNAAMIAAQGYYEYLVGRRADSHLNASAADLL